MLTHRLPVEVLAMLGILLGVLGYGAAWFERAAFLARPLFVIGLGLFFVAFVFGTIKLLLRGGRRR